MISCYLQSLRKADILFGEECCHFMFCVFWHEFYFNRYHHMFFFYSSFDFFFAFNFQTFEKPVTDLQYEKPLVHNLRRILAKYLNSLFTKFVNPAQRCGKITFSYVLSPEWLLAKLPPPSWFFFDLAEISLQLWQCSS